MTQQGTTFSNYFVTDSLCCPSRSSILRGQYVHNHGVHTNLPPTGGFEQFHALGNESSTIGTWMHAAGYHTGLLGKYLNGYPDTVARRYVPPGWDDWVSPSGGNPYAEYNYQLNDNGTLEHHGTQPSDYLVDLLSQKAGEFIGSAPKNKPFFLYVAPYVPHQPATPAPRYTNAFPGVQAPRPPSFDQVDPTAPAWLRDRPPLTAPLITTIDNLYRRRLQTMLGVDDMLANVVTSLQKSGQLDNTYIVFSSDNGFHLGEHRLPPGKQTAFEEDIHVPLVVRGPGVPKGKTVDTSRGERRPRAHVRRARSREGARFRERPVARVRAAWHDRYAATLRGARRALRRHSGRAWCAEAAEGAGRAEDNAELGNDGEDE